MTHNYTDQITAVLDTIGDDTPAEVLERLSVFEQSEVSAVVVKRLLDVEASGGGGASSVLMHAVNITSAQIKNWASVPVELIPAPGAGLAVMVFHMYVALTGVGTPYTDPDGSGTRYAGSATPAAAWQNVDITLGTDTVWWVSGGVTDALPSVSTDAAVEVFGAGAEPSGGDGVLRVVSYYAEVPLT